MLHTSLQGFDLYLVHFQMEKIVLYCAAILVVLASFDTVTSAGNGMHNIHWNSSNPLFRNRRDDTVIRVNGGNHPWEYDQVNIVCPFYKPGTKEAFQEKYIVYSVSKEEYESCRITQPNPRIIAVCDRPHELMYFTITFRSFTPTPGGLEFRPGQSYYFISTSSKNDIHRRVGGGCSTQNMKIIFQVAEEKPKPIVETTLAMQDENDNRLLDVSSDHFTMMKKMRPKAEAKASTLYYPLHEIAQVKEFFYNSRRQQKDFFSSKMDDPTKSAYSFTNSSGSRNGQKMWWEILLLIASIRFFLLPWKEARLLLLKCDMYLKSVIWNKQDEFLYCHFLCKLY